MAAFVPIYTYEIRKPRSLNDATESLVLTPPAGAPHADPCKFSSAPVDGFLPYADAPVGMRGELEPLEATVDKGQIRIRIVDRQTPHNDNAKRWFTAFLHDANGQDQILGGKVICRESLDGGATFSNYWVGRVEDYDNPDGKNEMAVLVRDLSEDLDVDVFVDRPHSSITYAALQRLAPVGLAIDYAGMPKVGKFVGTTRVATGLLRFGATGIVFPAAGVPAEHTVCARALADHIDTVEDAGDSGSTGNYLVQLLGGWGFAAETVRIVAKRLDTQVAGEFKCKALFVRRFGGGVDARRVVDVVPQALEATHPKYMPIPTAGVSVEWELFSTNGPSKAAPIVIGPIHPVQLFADLLDGKFGYLTDAGAVTRSVARDAASFSTLIADASFPLAKFIVPEKARLNDWVEEELCKAFGFAYGWNTSGEVVVYDQRNRSTGITYEGFDVPDNADTLPSRWTVWTYPAAKLGTLGGAAYPANGSQGYATIESGASDGVVLAEMTVVGGTNLFMGVIVRFTPGPGGTNNSYFRFATNGATSYVDRFDAGTLVSLYASFPGWVSGDRMKVVMSGSTLTFIKIDGATGAETVIYTDNSGTYATATKHGIVIQSTQTTPRIGWFSAPGLLAPATITDDDLVALEEGVGWHRSRRSAITRVDAAIYVDEYVSLVRTISTPWGSQSKEVLADAKTHYPDVPCHLIASTEVPVKLDNLGGRALDFGEKKFTLKSSGYRAATREATNGLPAIEAVVQQLHKRLQDVKVPFASGPMEYALNVRRGSAGDCQPGELRYLKTSFIVDPFSAQRMTDAVGAARLVRCVSRADDGVALAVAFIDLATALKAASPSLTLATVAGDKTSIDLTVTRNAANDPVLVEIALTDSAVTAAPTEGSSLWTPVGVREANGTFRLERLASGMKVWARARSQPGAGEKRYLPSDWVASTPASVTLATLSAPSGLTASATTSSSTTLAWTNTESDRELEVFVALTAAPPTWNRTTDRIAVLPAGTKRYVVRGLNGPSVTHVIGIRYRDQSGGYSAMATVVVATAGSGTPKKAPGMAGRTPGGTTRGFTVHHTRVTTS